MIRPSGSGLRPLKFALVAVAAVGMALVPISIEPWLFPEKYSECRPMEE